MISVYLLLTLYKSKDFFNILTIIAMSTLSNTLTAPSLEPKSKADGYYLLAMMVTVVVLFVFAYYDQIATGLLG